MTDEKDDNLVEVKVWKADGEPFLVLHRSPEEPFCGHRGQVLVNKDRRRVTCGQCGTVLDPFDVLWWFAVKEREFVYARDKKRTLEIQIEQLKAEERRVKARLNRALSKEQ
jgi:hypothetical protein